MFYRLMRARKSALSGLLNEGLAFTNVWRVPERRGGPGVRQIGETDLQGAALHQVRVGGVRRTALHDAPGLSRVGRRTRTPP